MTKPIVVISRWNVTVSVTQILEIMSLENFLGVPGRFVDSTSAPESTGNAQSTTVLLQRAKPLASVVNGSE